MSMPKFGLFFFFLQRAGNEEKYAFSFLPIIFKQLKCSFCSKVLINIYQYQSHFLNNVEHYFLFPFSLAQSTFLIKQKSLQLLLPGAKHKLIHPHQETLFNHMLTIKLANLLCVWLKTHRRLDELITMKNSHDSVS